jgi:RNA-directed DNA polymerase
VQVLQPLIDPTFSESSFGFRPCRNAHQAIDQAKKHVREGCNYVVDLDLADYFNRVNHDILMSKVARYISDKRLLRLIRRYLESGILERGVKVRSEEGVPQGGPLSPLLSNIMLDEVDKELEKRGHRFVRYADDVNVYVRTQRAGERVFGSITKYVETRLKLKVNREKSAVDKASKRKLLGFSFTGEREARVRLAKESIERFKEKVRRLTKRTAGISMQERIRRLNLYLNGWMRYFAKAETPSVIANLCSWVHRRMRLCVIYQWKRTSTWWKRLVALGLDSVFAAKIASSSKGWWRLSLTPQLHKALGKRYWKAQGLIDISELFTQIRNAF